MAIKKRKRSFGGGGALAGGSRSREQSLGRPKHVEKMPPCHKACPGGNRIRDFLTTIGQAERLGKSADQAFEEAWHIYTDTSPFPAICGRVCPHPCEDNCNRRELDDAVNINQVERAIGAHGLDKSLKLKMLTDEQRPESIAVVGAGPAGLSCAYQLARRGYGVTIFEAADKPGGMLLWGIPRYRLPADIVDGEIQKILDLGLELRCDTRIGKDVSLDDLRSRYGAVFVSIGADWGAELGVEGGGLIQVGENGASTCVEGVYACGDAAGLAPVTTAVGQGRRAAETIDCDLCGCEPQKDEAMPLIQADRMRLDHYEKKDRVKSTALPVEQRLAAMDTEVNQGITSEQAVEEATRCMSCGYCFDCEKCWLFCQEQAIAKPMTKGMLYTFNLQKCTGCRKCARECPCGFIDMV